MAATALEEKINKIRQQNEEIRRRYEEVEQDKKKAAESNALVQMVPSTDWPERKEPPEFSNPPRNSHKQKNSVKEHSEQPLQHHVEGRKGHSFAQGEGPPPDPKYNFLADSDREELSTEYTRDSSGGKGRGRSSRGNIRRRGGGRDGPQKDGRMYNVGHRDGYQPEYDAWRAERNRIDEDRISRQRTAEGNWRREWDNNKMHIVDDVSKRESRATFGDAIKRDKHFDNRHHSDGHEHMNYNRGGSQRGRGSQRGFHNHDHRYSNSYDQPGRNAQISVKNASHYLSAEERTVTATDKSIKVTLNQSGGVTKGPVTSVKVNSPNIAGTGRVGPRQRTRITYSSHSDFEANLQRDSQSFARQKSFEDKPKAVHYNNAQKVSNLKRTPSQKKKESKSPYTQRKEYKKEQSKEQKDDAKTSAGQINSESSAKQVADTTAENVAEGTNASEKEAEVISIDAGSPSETDGKSSISEHDQSASDEMEGQKIEAINENVPSGKEENVDCAGLDDEECLDQGNFDHPPADKTNLDLLVNAKEEKDAVISSETVENVDENAKDITKDEKVVVDETPGNESVTSPIENSVFTTVPSQENNSENQSIDNAGTDKQIDKNDDIIDDCKERQPDDIPLDNCDNIKHETIDAESCERDNNQVSNEYTGKESLEAEEIESKKVSTVEDTQVLEVKVESSNEKEIVQVKDVTEKEEVKENPSNEVSIENIETTADIRQSDDPPEEISKETVESICNVQVTELEKELEAKVEREIIEAKDNVDASKEKEELSNEIPNEVVEASIVKEKSCNEINVADGDKENVESLSESTENNVTRDVPPVLPAAEIKSQDEDKASSAVGDAVEQTTEKTA